MNRKLYEQILQNYLTINNGLNLRKIDTSLSLIESEHRFNGGRIDILAKNEESLIGMELKASDYSTRGACVQLLNYLNYFSEHNGRVYFIAPKIKYGVYSTLKSFYEEDRLRFFEFRKRQENYFFSEIYPDLLDDRRKVECNFLDNSTENEFYESKIKKGLAIVVKDKKKYKLIESIIDSRNSGQKQLENIADNTISILFSRKYSFIKTAYELLKLL